ncbi:hypothetical protein K2X89_09135 [Myxococcota bacterium]|nr:hypothetical protein [Myxococcota bacterium]
MSHEPTLRRLVRLLPRVGWLTVVAMIALARSGHAQIVTVPPGLAPGASYRLIFVTSAVRNGASGNVADYNTFVSNAANAVPALAALNTTWKAVAETPAITAQDNTQTNPQIVGGTPNNRGFPFHRLDGARVAIDNVQFWSMASPIAPISITELGTTTPLTTRPGDTTAQPWVWTGVDSGPAKLGSSAPIAGWTNGGSSGNAWIGIALSGSSNAHAVYAVSGILQAPLPVPVLPIAAVTMLLGGISIGVAALRPRGSS